MAAAADDRNENDAPQLIAVLGAESTGKTLLCTALQAALGARGHAVTLVPEYLRDWCAAAGRTPHAHEQAGIAQTHAVLLQDAWTQAMERWRHGRQRRDGRNKETAPATSPASASLPIVIADTTPLMGAVYSDWLFGDRSLYAFAEALHRQPRCRTLVTAPDIAWVPDGLQREGPQVREPVDALLRAALQRAGVSFGVIHGSGDARLAAALRAIGATATAGAATAPPSCPAPAPPLR